MATAPQLQWTAPASWTAKPASPMRLATYAFVAADGTEADVSVFSFPDAAGGLLANINRWRAQVGLSPVDAPEQSATQAVIAGLPAWRVDFAGVAPDGPPSMGGTLPVPPGPARILGAIVPVGGQAWFFKMIGPEAVVGSQQPAFEEFVASIRPGRTTPATTADPHAGVPGAPPLTSGAGAAPADPHAGVPGAPPLMSGGSSADPHAGLDMSQMAAAASTMPMPEQPAAFTFHAPEGWQEQPGSAMRVASFSVQAAGHDPADVSVFALGGPAGGEVANVNRWRAQLRQPPLDPMALMRSATEVAGRGVVFRVFEIEGSSPSIADGRPSRILAAIVPHGDRTWFVKMTGESAHISSQRDTFIQFLKSFDFEVAP